MCQPESGPAKVLLVAIFAAVMMFLVGSLPSPEDITGPAYVASVAPSWE